jgi:cyclic pyranopterin phosphate synthase
MPAEGVVFQPREQLLTFEEIERFVRIVAGMGVSHLRLTGGEPLVRADVADLVRLLVAIPGIEDVALTTNGVLLTDQAQPLVDAGLHRINISLDTLSEATFEKITRRSGLAKVLEGIAAAKSAGFKKIRLNAIAIRGLTEDEILPLSRFAREHRLELRFIEFMPLDAENSWNDSSVLSGREIRSTIEKEFGSLTATERTDLSQPSVDYVYRDVDCRVGFINPITEPFCGACNRLRLTAEGAVRNCLFSNDEMDVRTLLRNGSSDQAIGELVRECVGGKRRAHGIDDNDFVRPARAMYQIGG